MNVSSAFRFTTDFITSDVKHFAKRFYRGPVIKFAYLYRYRLHHVKFIGITGSSGKTTTKELVHLILSKKFYAYKSSDSNNQLYSVARTLLAIPSKVSFCVQELGISGNDDFTSSIKLLRPNIGVLINIGTEHYKAYRGKEGVAKEKIKLINTLPANGIAVVNGDDELILQLISTASCKVITFGLGENCDLRATQIFSEWPKRLTMLLTYRGDVVECNTQLCGEHLVYTVLAALATGLACGIKLRDAAISIKDFKPFLGRMMPYETTSGITFIRDEWKAPYWSIAQPINFIKHAQALRKIIILGTLSDYPGSMSNKYRNVSLLALDSADHVFFVGNNADHALRIKKIPHNKSLRAFSTTKLLADYLKTFLLPGDLVLLKGSAGDHLSRIALMYEKDVKCWVEKCKRNHLCDKCVRLSLPILHKR